MGMSTNAKHNMKQQQYKNNGNQNQRNYNQNNPGSMNINVNRNQQYNAYVNKGLRGNRYKRPPPIHSMNNRQQQPRAPPGFNGNRQQQYRGNQHQYNQHQGMNPNHPRNNYKKALPPQPMLQFNNNNIYVNQGYQRPKKKRQRSIFSKIMGAKESNRASNNNDDTFETDDLFASGPPRPPDVVDVGTPDSFDHNNITKIG